MSRSRLRLTLLLAAVAIARGRRARYRRPVGLRQKRTRPSVLAVVPAEHAQPQRQARGTARRRVAGAGNRHGQPPHPDQLPGSPDRPRFAKCRSSVSTAAPTPASCEAYSQGDGASFLPSTAFEPGERVTRGAPRHRAPGRASSSHAQATASEKRVVLRISRGHALFDDERPRRFPTLRPHPRTTRASTLCQAPKPRF